MAKKDYNITIEIDSVVHSSISRYRSGYNYANIGIKVADDEFMSVSYEWSGKHIPEFALNVMDIMKTGNESASAVDAESIERAAAILSDIASKIKEDTKKK